MQTKPKLCVVCNDNPPGILGKRSAKCVPCFKRHTKKLRQNRIEYARESNLWYKYRVTLDSYNKMFEKQQGCCAICNAHQSEFKKRLFVDHNHITGKIRSLLCSKCNMSLGHYENNKQVFEEYLNKYDVVATIEREDNE